MKANRGFNYLQITHWMFHYFAVMFYVTKQTLKYISQPMVCSMTSLLNIALCRSAIVMHYSEQPGS